MACAIALLAFWIFGAFLIPAPPALSLTTPRLFTDFQKQLAKHSNECRQPFPAAAKLDSSFKYGCFCGKGHPALHYKSGKTDSKLSLEERTELASEYLKIKPIDSIDHACQLHDICWTMQVMSMAACNDEFERSLKWISYYLRESAGAFDTNSSKTGCAVLAADLGMASMFIMEAKSETRLEDNIRTTARAVNLPLLLGYLATHKGLQITGIYPSANDRCKTHVPDFHY